MRRTSVVAHVDVLAVPRGWFVLSAILGSWVLVAGLWAGTSQLFTFVAAAI
jgi:hypothetical protein